MNVYNYYKNYENLTELSQSWKLNQCIFFLLLIIPIYGADYGSYLRSTLILVDFSKIHILLSYQFLIYIFIFYPVVPIFHIQFFRRKF